MFNKKGFTLIEVLIVVAIIGILASVVLVTIGPVQRQARDSRRISDLKQIQASLELYYGKCSYYPGNTEAAATGICSGYAANNTYAGLRTAITGSLLGVNNFPSGANTGGEYLYGGSATDYVLGARMNDTNNPSLRDDIDVTVNGVDCADPVYCIRN